MGGLVEVFCFLVWCCFSGGDDGWVSVVGLSFGGKWLLVVVRLLDLVVVGTYVGLMDRKGEEETKERDGREERN